MLWQGVRASVRAADASLGGANLDCAFGFDELDRVTHAAFALLAGDVARYRAEVTITLDHGSMHVFPIGTIDVESNGSVNSPATASVPQPGTLMLLAAGALALSNRARRQR